jgi:hypothetical protein
MFYRMLFWSMACYSMVFCMQRVVMLGQEWLAQRDLHRTVMKEWITCQSMYTKDSGPALTMACESIRMKAERSPLLDALQHVLQNTHVCGSVSCTDVFLYILNSAPTMITLVVVSACASVLFAYHMGKRLDYSPAMPYAWPLARHDAGSLTFVPYARPPPPRSARVYAFDDEHERDDMYKQYHSAPPAAHAHSDNLFFPANAVASLPRARALSKYN